MNHTGLCPRFQAKKATVFTIFELEWWPPNTSTMRATRQEEPAPGEYLVPFVARLSYPMCQDVCQVLLVRGHISFVVNRPIILPGRPETRIQVTHYIPNQFVFNNVSDSFFLNSDTN